MASVKIKNIANVKERIRREFSRIKSDPKLLTEIADVVVADIVGNARAGKGTDLKPLGLQPLSESWVKTRAYLGKFNRTGEFFLGYASRKSNVTFTGKLLESIKAKISTQNAQVEIYADGMHPGYRTGSGQSKSFKNSDLVNWLEGKGYVFMTVSDRLRKRVNVLTKRFIRNLIRTKKL